MWFKNLYCFDLSEPFEMDIDALCQQLSQDAFVPCGSSVVKSSGWVCPNSRQSMVVEANQCFFLAYKTQEKIVPASVINDLLAERIDEIQNAESRAVKKSERQTLKEDIFASLLPRAFVKNSIIYAYIDRQAQRLVINTPSSAKAEAFSVELRKSLGSLKIQIPALVELAGQMTSWVTNGEVSEVFEIADKCVLKDADENAGVIRCQKQNLMDDDIQALIGSGRDVVELSLVWNEKMSFVLDENFALKGVKYLADVQDQVKDINADSDEQRFDADMHIMVETHRDCLQSFIELHKQSL